MENCISTSVFARQSPQNTINTVMFAPKGRKYRTYRGFWLVRRQKHGYLQCCLLRWSQKKRKNTTKHILFDDFWLLKNEKKNCVVRWLQDDNQADDIATTITGASPGCEALAVLPERSPLRGCPDAQSEAGLLVPTTSRWEKPCVTESPKMSFSNQEISFYSCYI